ncbi:unnamed protein product [Phytophthora fragariaefolia]|uniref:Unnamed protein product n=1 Tax=Phytophthora fragariaefolia TaxID=1490495 RepID=A0A9W6WJD0_9STRA|nr:unnamed protein product [Phytophthora fragariaefolia]
MYLMSTRDETYEKFEQYYEQVKTHLNVRMKEQHNDNAKEILKLGGICSKKYGMEYSTSVKHTPEQNGVAERMIRTLSERMRCMLNHFPLPQEMWAEAAITATYNVNIVPNSTRDMEVPYAIWHRKMPAYSKLRGFGCAVLAYVDKVERWKMDAKAREAVFVGYSRDDKGYRLLDSKMGKSFYSHTPVFFEEKSGRLPQQKLSSPSPTASHAPTTEYLGVDKRVMQKLPSLMDTLSDPNGSRPGGTASETDDDLAGGAISMERGARSGGSKKRQEHGPHREPHRPQTNSAHTERGRASCGASEKAHVERERGRAVSDASGKKKRGRTTSGALQGRVFDQKRLHSSNAEEATNPQVSAGSAERTTSKKEKRGLVELQPHGDAEVSRANGNSNESSPPERTGKEASTVTRSGRISKPPHWFGDFIHLAYIATNPKRHNQLASTVWEKAREELQYDMAKVKAFDW